MSYATEISTLHDLARTAESELKEAARLLELYRAECDYWREQARSAEFRERRALVAARRWSGLAAFGWLFLVLALATGCEPELLVVCDLDEDGFDAHLPQVGCIGDDCDDEDAESFPGAAEVCDGLDNDCDGLLGSGGDEPAEDQDNDRDRVIACLDCDDTDARIGECDE